MDAVSNFAYSSVQAGSGVIGSGTGTTVIVATGDSALFPDPAIAGQYNIEVWPPTTQQLSTNTEIMRVTAKSSNTLTVARAQEGTTALTGITTSYQVAMGITKQVMVPDFGANVIGAFGKTDPQDLLTRAVLGGNVAPTPTAITTSIARIAYFRPQVSITVNRVRWFGVGALTNVYRVAVYNGDTLAAVIPSTAITTAVSTWGSFAPASPPTLVANQLYFVAVAVNTTGTTAGMLAFTSTQAATTGMIAVLPKSFPGNLDLDAGFMDGAFAQFAVTTGAMGDPAGTIVVQSAWTGGFPAIFLDNNTAA